jgi:rubrerythrin
MEPEKSRDTAFILNKCAVIENLRAETYDFLADAYRFHPKISALFRKTANEERNHEYQFLMALKKFIPAIAGSAVAVDAVEKYTAFSHQAFESVRNEVPSIADALKMSILSETAFRQFHMDTAVFFEETSLSALFKAMMAGDDEHVESLKRAHAEYLREVAAP